MPRRDPAKEEYWRRQLCQWRRSGLTPREFCVDQRISEPSFYAWRREIDRRDRQTVGVKKATGRRARGRSVQARPSTERPAAGQGTAAFVELTMAGGAVLPPAIEVVVAERRLLRVRPGFDADLLRQLVRLLEEPSC
jgi:hypothetical protein